MNGRIRHPFEYSDLAKSKKQTSKEEKTAGPTGRYGR